MPVIKSTSLDLYLNQSECSHEDARSIFNTVTNLTYPHSQEFLIKGSIFCIKDNLVYCDLPISRACDMYKDIKIDNAVKVELVVDSLSETLPSEIVIRCAIYNSLYLRIYFDRDHIPETFKITSTCTLFSRENISKIIQMPIQTDKHIYKNGMIAKLSPSTRVNGINYFSKLLDTKIVGKIILI